MTSGRSTPRNVVRHILQGAFQGTQIGGEPIDELDEAFRPSTQLSTQPARMAGARDKKRDSLLEDDGEVIEHDAAHRVFRSPRPSITLQELQELHERESGKQLGDGASEHGDTPGHSAMRGGIFGGDPLHDLWLAQEMDVGGLSCLLASSVVLDTEAHEAWEEAAKEKHGEGDWRAEDVFIDSETEDVTFGDGEMEDAEEAFSDEWLHLET